MTVAMIMVMDRNRLIGNQGGMPWHIPSELKYFKSVTMGKPMIMGRKTFESLGKALPGRTNIVVTSNADFKAEDVLTAQDFESALDAAGQHLNGQDEIMIIGGARLCAEAMPRTEKLYLTVIDEEFSGDTWLDSYNADEWLELSRNEQEAGGHRLAYLVLERNNNPG